MNNQAAATAALLSLCGQQSDQNNFYSAMLPHLLGQASTSNTNVDTQAALLTLLLSCNAQQQSLGDINNLLTLAALNAANNTAAGKRSSTDASEIACKKKRQALQVTQPTPNDMSTKSQTRRLTLQLDPSKVTTHAKCRLCNNDIAATRLSNLTNHVRRHATLKQFQCRRCDYAHNEMAKVRLHMQHNHKITDEQPLDNISSDMQQQWDTLMLQCFPECVRESSLSNDDPYKSNSAFTAVGQSSLLNNRRRNVTANGNRHTCVECGELVGAAELKSHIQTVHTLTSDDSYEQHTCTICNFAAYDQMMIVLHMTMQHERSDMSHVRSARVPYDATVLKYFPSAMKASLESTLNSGSQQKHPFAPTAPLLTDQQLGQLSGSNNNNNAVSDVDLRDVQCQLCHKIMRGQRSVSSLVSHAKRHYHIKQYACPVAGCSYSSAESTHVRAHVKTKHKEVTHDMAPIDNKSAHLQNAWMAVTAKCFPCVRPNLSKHRFKTQLTDESDDELKVIGTTPPATSHTGTSSLSPASTGDNALNMVMQQCRLCHERIAEESQRAHAQQHPRCRQCGYLASNDEDMQQHCDEQSHEPVKTSSDDSALDAVLTACFGKE